MKLQNLSEQLDPMEAAYAEVRFFDADVVQTQQQYEDIMSLMDNEIRAECILLESTRQLADELEKLKTELSMEQCDQELLDEVCIIIKRASSED